MALSQAGRKAPLLSTLVLGAGTLLLISLLAHAPRSFVAPVNHGNARGRVAMRGFKEDFEAWKGALTDEERAQIQEQAEGEFNKKFRKSEAFKKDLPQEKVESFAKVLGKFFDAEAEDYKKEKAAIVPDYDGLLKKAKEGSLDFSLRLRTVEIDRDADRRYQLASLAIDEAAAKGEKFPQSSPLQEIHGFKNDDEENHEHNKELLKLMIEAAEDKDVPKEAKKSIDEWAKKGIPKMGEKFELLVPQVLVKQVDKVMEMLDTGVAQMVENKTEAERKATIEEFDKENPTLGAQVVSTIVNKYVKARAFIEEDVEKEKKYYRSMRDMPGKTKADVLKELWAELPKYADVPVPPLDDEMLAELAQEPASPPEEITHNWGTADKLYKSEAIDAFGGRYLLGLFETKDEAAKAFEVWNKEYEAARASLKDEMTQWTKQEQARLDADVVGQARIKELLSGNV